MVWLFWFSFFLSVLCFTRCLKSTVSRERKEHLLEAASPSWPSPLALWPVRPTTEGRGEHSAPGDEAWER